MIVVQKVMRQRRVLNLMTQGYDDTGIARMMGIPLVTVREDLKALRERLVEELQVDAREQMALDLRRLDELMRTMLPEAMGGNMIASREVREIIAARRAIIGYGAAERLDVRAEIITWALERGIDVEEALAAAGPTIIQG